jgi:signal transduction histidine kinase
MTGAAIHARRVLIVEDSATQAAALAVLLEQAGYDTVIARRADRALELLEREQVNLVLSDVVMPGMDGYELCREVKSRPEWKDIPVVLLTSLTDPLAIVRGLASGADHYVTKPYDAEGLLARVEFVLDRVNDPKIKLPAPISIDLLGTSFTIRATKEHVLELLVSSYSDLVRTSDVVRQAERRARFLAEATEVLSSTLDAQQVLLDLARLSVPRIADLVVADLLDNNGLRHRAAVEHAIENVELSLDVVAETALYADLVAEVIRDATPRLVEIPDAATLAQLVVNRSVLEALATSGAHTLQIIPLVARGRVLGLLHLLSASVVSATRVDDQLLLEDLARRAALAVDNALLYEEAQRATRARDDVLAIVSHDLRNPINTIQMSVSFLLDVLADGSAEPPPVVPQLQVMQRATRRANALIQDLLDVSRIDAGTLAVETTAIDASLLLRDAVLESEPLVAGKKLVFGHAWTGPDLLVAADRSRIGQVFSNLVGNAIKFTKAGGTVRIEGMREGDSARFDVIDTGGGIVAEHVPHLFDRFWQASNTSRTGAGLGLFIVKGIVEAHGGQVEVFSVLGEGTRFRFTVPAAVKRAP